MLRRRRYGIKRQAGCSALPAEISGAIRSSRSCASSGSTSTLQSSRRSSEYSSISVIAASIAFVLLGSPGMNSTRVILLTQEPRLGQTA